MPSASTGISAGLSLIGINEGRKASKRAGDASDAQLQLMMERDKFNKDIIKKANKLALEDRADFIERRQRERDLVDPVQEAIISEAMAPIEGKVRAAEARSDADVAIAFGVQRERAKRDRQRYGVNPAAGAMMAEERRFAGAEALAQVSGRTRARLAEEDKDWARKIAAYGTGNIRNAQASTSLQQLGVPGAAGVQGQIAGQEASSAAAAFGLSGKLAADAARYWDTAGGGGGSFSGGSMTNWAGSYGATGDPIN